MGESTGDIALLFKKLRKLPGIAKGIFGAMGFLGAAPQFIPYSVLEIVSFVHAIIIGWNSVMSGAWALFSEFLPLPELAPELISAAVLGASISATWAYSIFKSERGSHRVLVQSVAYWIRIIAAFLDGPLFCILAFATYPNILFWFALIPIFSIWMVSLVMLPRYRAGVLVVMGFLGFMEIVYLMSTDQVRERFDEFVCEQAIGLPQCDIDGGRR